MGSVEVFETLGGNLEVVITHTPSNRIRIERADIWDAFSALKEYLGYRMCLECGSPDPRCQCWNDE